MKLSAPLWRRRDPCQSSQVVFLLCRTRILCQVPFDVAILVLKGSAANLKHAHGHTRPNLRELYTVISRAHENMVTHLNAVIDVLERHNSVADLVFTGDGFPRREDVFQDLDHSCAQRCIEPVENEMRVGFADSSPDAARYIVSQNDIV